jgi:hypothetical protein
MVAMEVVDVWTGRTASCLRTALRMTNEEFAHRLGTAVRTVAKWNAEPDVVPAGVMQRALDTMLQTALPDARSRFGLLSAELPALASPVRPVIEGPSAELRLAADPAISEVLSWIDDRARWPDGQARRRVAERLDRHDAVHARDVAHARRQVTRHAIAEALAAYYKPREGFTAYKVSCAGQTALTSILTRAEWLNLRLTLGQDDSMTLSTTGPPRLGTLDDQAAAIAVRRVADALSSGTPLINTPIYDLQHIDVTDDGRVTAQFGLTDFLSYALTLDLLQQELTDAIAGGRADDPAAFPLRPQHLPDLAAVTDLSRRICAGGPPTLFAAARPASRRGTRGNDYVIFIQERSGRTMNEAGRLAVIPKAIHEPLIDFSDDAHIVATIEREMEEELFGREDVDSTVYSRRHADPLHLSRLSPPMRWLIDHDDPDTWRIECTGFGLNLVSGNFEFAGLIVIEDETWWSEYGGSIEANWETEGLRRYSTRDRHGLADLVHDPSWSNEGLFALLEGLRRLAEIGGQRVDIPEITVEA